MTYLDPVKKLVEEADEGPWLSEGAKVFEQDAAIFIAQTDADEFANAEANARFIAASRSLLPLLLEVCEAGEKVWEQQVMDNPEDRFATVEKDDLDALKIALDTLRQHLEDGTPHDHPAYVEGCFRCDLSREEGK